MSWLPAAISGASSLINTVANQAFAESNRSRNFYWNEKAAKESYERQREFYQEFQSPKGQLENIKKAGLSPSLMYGQLGGAGGASQVATGGIQGPYPQGNIIDPLTMAQVANVNADTQLKESQAEKTDNENIAQKIENYISTSTMPTTIEKIYADLEKVKADIDAVKTQTAGDAWQNAFNQKNEKDIAFGIIARNSEMLLHAAEMKAGARLKEQERIWYQKQISFEQIKIAQRWTELDIQSDAQHAQEEWFENQAFGMLKNIDLDFKDLDFRKEQFKFESGEKFNWQKTIDKWDIGIRIGSKVAELGLDAWEIYLRNQKNKGGLSTKEMLKLAETAVKISNAAQ